MGDIRPEDLVWEEQVNKLKAENEELKQLKQRVESNIFNSMGFHQLFWDCINNEEVDFNKVEYKLHEKLQQLLKDDTK